MHRLRLLPALVRAALPIVGVVWLRWPLATVLFYYWIELALLAADSYILFLREGHAGNLFEGLLGALAMFAPVVILAATLAPVDVRNYPAVSEYVLGLLETPGMRAALALQVLVAIVFAIVRDVNGPGGEDRLSKQMQLMLDRFTALVLVAFVVGLVLAGTGIGMPETGNTRANAIAVSTVSLVWLFSDVSPARLHQMTSFLYEKGRSKT